MLIRLSSILGMFMLVAALASPAYAQDDDDEEESSERSGDSDSEGGDDEEYEEPDAWEAPPPEKEVAPKAEKKKVEEVLGDGNDMELQLLIGYGFDTSNDYAANPYGMGFGLRAHYTFPFQLQVGLLTMYHLGGSVDDANGSSSASYLLLQGEVAYNFWISSFVIRPYLGLGVGLGIASNSVIPALDGTAASFAFSPGFALLYTFDDWHVGMDLRFNTMGSAPSANGTTIALVGGLRF